MPWPSPAAYHEAVQNPQTCFFDPDLKAGTITTDHLGLPIVRSGNFASVYEIRNGAQRWGVRCFLRQVSDQQQRYISVSQHLDGVLLPCLIAFKYQEQGIRTQGQTYPIVKMDWVEGKLLTAFIDDQIKNPQTLLQLAARWRGIVNSLHGNRLAHGDLQHGNILVTAQGEIKLVDYDAMFVPALRGKPSPELGHRNYQHPQRTADDFDNRLDNFAAIVIYLSLRALAADGSLWQQFYTGENLIFSSADYTAPMQSAVFRRLQSSSDFGVRALAAELEQCCLGTMVQIPDFESVVHALPIPSASFQQTVVTSPSSPLSPQVQLQPWWNATYSVLPPTTPSSPTSALPVSAALPPPIKTLPPNSPPPSSINSPVQAPLRSAPALSQTPSAPAVLKHKPSDIYRQVKVAGSICTCIVIVAGITWQFLWNNSPTNAPSSLSASALGNTERPIGNTVGSDPHSENSNDVIPSVTPPAYKKNLRDDAEMVFIPAGEFTMGSTQSELDALAKQYTPDSDKGDGSQHKAILDSYYIYRTPVTVAQYLKFCDDTGHSKPPATIINPNWGKRDHPIVNVSYHDALAYCEWAGVKLPTEAQWEKAARGTDARTYPWGNVFDSYKLWCLHSPAFVNYSGGTAPVDSFPDGASPFGVLDMAGNVAQWCSDWYDKDFPSSRLATERNPENQSFGAMKYRVLRGGSWRGTGPVCFRSAYRDDFGPNSRYDDVGFRCASGL
jgi:formylglycine-generating enzyme required for sulfatase activity